MAEGKWIPDLRPETPVAEAARRALTVRLEVVHSYLGLALSEPEKDPEYVHQLRVGTRRAVAALEIFAGCLPDKTYRGARRRLRRLRRAAGAARDWDVFLATLAGQGRRVDHRPGDDFLLGYALGQRVAAQGRLEEASPEGASGFRPFLARTVGAVREPSPEAGVQTLLGLARPLLRGLLKELEEAAARDLGDYQHLHRVRIIGKRLRYAMELFAECFAAPFREHLYPAVEEMQDVLGRANDSHVAAQRLVALRDHLRAVRPSEWKRFQPEVDRLLRYHRRRLPQERRRFLKWLGRWEAMKAPAEFDSLLKTPQGIARLP